MRPLLSLASLCCALSLLLTPTVSHAGTNLVTTVIQAAGANWSQAIWKTNNGGIGTGTALVPVAGNTYTCVSNGTALGNSLNATRIRPPTTGAATFPGDSLTLLTNTELRLKVGSTANSMNFPGVGGNPGLILNGGLIDGGDDATYPMTGIIQVATRSYISHGANGAGGGISQNRALNFTGTLTGSGTLVIMNSGLTLPQIVSGTANTFSGNWIVQCGWLQGTAANSLGTNSITVDPGYLGFLADMNPTSATSPAGPARFEPNYNLNSAGVLTLTNGGTMRLHQEVAFSAAVIEGTALSAGVHYFADLAAAFPANFEAGGSGAIVIQPFGVLPPIPPTITTQPVSTTVYTNGTARFSVTVNDNGFPPLVFQWRTNGVALPNSGRVSGATNSILVISNTVAADASVTYDVVVNSAALSPVTSVAVSLTLVATNGEAYAAAALAAAPVAFYEFNETADPSSGTASAYDLYGGYIGVYGAGAQNGFNSVTGPQNSDGPFPGFADGNFAAQTTLGTANSRVAVLPWNLKTNTVTLTAWVNPSGGQNPNEGLVFCRGGATVAGLCYASTATLGYNWNNEPDTYNWNSGLNPPPGQWSLVALVVTPAKATIYMLNTSGLAASQHVYNHVTQPFEGTTVIGDDPAGTAGNRSFSGKVDDVAVFNRALSPADIMALYSAASGVASFSPQIAIQPVSLSLFQTQTAQFTGLAVGSDPLTYQWLKAPAGSGGPYVNLTDGGQISGSTTPTLTITGADFANAADYIVIATNSSLALGTASLPANLAILATNAPSNVTMTNQEVAGADWDLGLNSPGANTNWSDFNPATYSAAQAPGNTYEVLPGARLRSPDGPVITTFPGKQLTLDGDGVWNVNPGAGATIGELRFKQHTYGTVNGVVNIPKLVMNGGQLDLGNDGSLILNGEIDILANTPINNDSANDRGYVVNSWLTGSGPIEYHGYAAAYQSNFVNSLNVAGTSNTFSGTWNVVTGTLLGTGTNALGTNHIFVGANGAVETTYNLNNTNAYLVINGGKMFLHQTDRFKSAVINGVSVAPGTYTFTAMNTSFPTNFPLVWAPKLGATNFTTASGSIIILSNASPLITTQPRSITNRGQQTATFSVTAAGAAALRYQWMAGAAGSGIYTNLINAPNVSGGVTNATLTLTNLSSANAGDYVVVVTNTFGATTSLVARLTVLDAPFITLQPISQTNSGTLTAQFFVSSLGDLPLTYQWQAGPVGGPYTNVNFGPKVSGATTTNLTITLLAVSNSADYIVVVANSFGTVTSSVATLTVIDPLLVQQPTPAGTMTLFQQSSAQWTVAILGTPPLVSQWQGGVAGSGVFTNMINGPSVSGAASTTLTINNVDFGDAGDYRYIVSNASGSVTSAVVSLLVQATNGIATAYTLDFTGLPIQQVAGLDWNSLNNWNPDGDSAANTAPARPGSTYTVVPGARLRSTAAVSSAIFPGQFTPGTKLILAGIGVWTNNAAAGDLTMGELRFKHNNPGTNFFRQLVMNGGQLDNGDNGMITLQGEMDILANTPIYVDNAAADTTRAYRIESWLTGNGNIEYHAFGGVGNVEDLNIVGATNTYSGTWHVVLGGLLGSGPNSLGTNSITVDAGGALETSYNLNTPTANLVLNGQMYLHNNDTFRTVTIGNYSVPAGFYTCAQWAGSFPGNFPGVWALQTGSSVATASGSMTVLVGPAINPITNNFALQGTNLVISGTGGLPNGHYFMLSSTNLALPKASWTRLGPYPFDGSGNYAFTNGITSNPAQQYFQLQQQVP